MVLKDLIANLETRDPNIVVKNGFGEGFSDRGDYSNACFMPIEETTYGEMLTHAKALLGTTQTGYKGGEFRMHEYVETHIGEYGSCGEQITSFSFLYWDLIAEDVSNE